MDNEISGILSNFGRDDTFLLTFRQNMFPETHKKFLQKV